MTFWPGAATGAFGTLGDVGGTNTEPCEARLCSCAAVLPIERFLESDFPRQDSLRVQNHGAKDAGRVHAR